MTPRIFVVGCPRSGTTLVQSIIAAHSSVFSCKETFFFARGFFPFVFIARKKKLLANFQQHAKVNDLGNNDDIAGWSAELSQCHSQGEIVQWFVRFFDMQAKKAGKSRWAEKTPEHLLYVPLLQKEIPDAVFVHVIRKGQATISSWVNESRTREKRYPVLLLFLYWLLSLRYSNTYVRKDPPRHFVVFYEDLISDSKATIEALFSKLSMSVEENLLERREQQAGAIADNVPWMKDVFGKIEEKHEKQTPLPSWMQRASDSAYTRVMRSAMETHVRCR